MNEAELKQLLLIIGQQLDWGDSATWQSKDFEILNQLILEKTKVSLSASTLRRIWGRVEYNHLPIGTTLDTLAQFAGFENRRAFIKQQSSTKADMSNVSKPKVKVKQRSSIRLMTALFLFALVAISLAAMYVKRTSTPNNTARFSFDTKPVTHCIPNSVIFTYDAKANPGDSVFIQQSWDPNTRVVVDKNEHHYTSIYYRPGFYHAKLGINNKVVKERLLLIPTNGWLGMIARYPVPV